MTDPSIRLLIVEDNPADARLIRELLRGASTADAVTNASRLSEALEHVRRDAPDVVLLDLSLPDASGVDTVRRMRAASSRIALVVLTGHQDEALAVQALRHGVDDYLVKGDITAPVLARSVRYAVERRRAITELASSEERFRLLMESVHDYAIYTIDPGGRVTSWNIGAERIKGYRPAEILGRDFRCFYPDEDRTAGAPERELEAAMAAGRHECEGWRIRKDGERFWAVESMTPLRDDDGYVRGFAKVTRDATAARAATEREQRAREAAEEANRLKDAFLATLSHELRTPLNLVLGWAHVLRDGKVNDTACARRALDVIARNAEIQARLVQDLLDMSQIEGGKLQLAREFVDVAAAVEEAVRAVRPMAEAKAITLSALVPAHAGVVPADAARLQQILGNLLTNAVKFTAFEGHVRVRVERDSSDVAFIVEDNGQGIAQEFLPHVFEAFRQGDSSSTRQHGGLGLGLALVHRLVRLHGGDVTAASAGVGRGATFTVRLPTADPT